MIGIRGIVVVSAALALAGCDSKPNAAFEQSVKDREAAKAGDPYATLDNAAMPKQSRYIAQKEELRQDYAAGQAGTYRATYDSMLTKLDADKQVDRAGELFTACRAAFAATSVYQSGAGKDAATSAPAREQALAGLKNCRGEVLKVKGEDGNEAGATLARFAAAGVVLIGVTLVGQGDAAQGLKIWREGDELVAQHRPGFQLDAKSFRGY